MSFSKNILSLNLKIKPLIVFAAIFGMALCAQAGEVSYRTGARSLISFSGDNPYLPILLLFGFLFACATFYSPRFGLIVMLFFILIATDMPIGRSEGMQRSVTLRVEDMILLVVSGGWLLNRARTRSLTSIKNVPILLAILLMSLVIVVSTFVGYFQETVPPVRGFFFAMKRLEYFWIFIMTLNLMETDKEVKIAFSILLGVAVVIACIGMTQFFLFPVSELTEGGATATAGFGRANTMGDFLLIVIGLSLGLVIYAAGPKTFVIYLSLLIVFSIALIMTKSRGGYISVPPLLFVIFAISRNKKALTFLGAAGVVVALYFFAMSMGEGNLGLLLSKHHSEISEQFTQIGDIAKDGMDSDPSLRSRLVSWEESIDQIISYPFLGQGCGAKRLGYSDNQYVRELLETGIIGFLIFLYMNLAIFLFMLRFFLTTENNFSKSLSLGFMGGHAGMMVHGITMSNFYTIFNMEIFWFVLALISLLYYNEKRAGNEIEGLSNERKI